MVFAIVVSISMVSAQQITVNGTVTDKSGIPIPGVSIVVKNSTKGTITDFDGKYSLDIENPNSVLVFSFIGMQTQELAVNSQTTINVTLNEDVLGLDEVVVVGYGTQAKKDVTGSVSLVSTDDMESRPNTQVGSLIQGKAAGVKVVSSSGKPNQGLSIRIRGTNSINAGSEPLYVVDGVPTTDTRSINPSDVESISILKDASSAAIYGAQGSNGVVIITTKRGTTDKPRVTLDAYTGFSQVWKKIDVLNGDQYRELMQDMGQETDWDLYNHNTNWQDEVFQNGASQNVQFSLSGTSNKTNYYMSGGYVKQVGAVRSSEMDRKNFKINLDQEVYDWLKVGSRIAYTRYSDVDVTDNTNVNYGGVLLGALCTPSVIDIYNEDGTFTANPFQDWENPVASTDGNEKEYNSDRILANAYTELSIIEGLKLRSNFGIDNAHSVYDYFLDPFRTSYGRALQGRAQNSTNKSSYYIFDNTLRYKKEFAAHKIEALAGTVIQKFKWENNSITSENFSGDGIKTVNGGSKISASGNKSEKANSSFMGRLNYDFADKYLLTSNFRYDGSSVFGPDHRWGFFPSFSAGWRISQETFMSSINVINDLKLRAGWGVVGNDQIGNYAYLGIVGTGANYPIGGEPMPGTYPASIENTRLKWEESEQTNIGIDLAILNSRLTFTADYYIKNTSDLLLRAPLPHSTGFDNAIQNIGELQNKGLEFAIKSVNIEGELTWTSDFNISFNKNKITNLVGQEMVAGNIAGRGDAILIKEDYSLGTFYGYEYGGVDPETGNVYYIDSLGESTFTPDAERDRKVIGNANPDFTYGLTNTITYKGLTFSLFLEGAKGNEMLNASRFDTEGMTDPKNQSTVVVDRWQQSGDITDVPRASWGNTNNSRISDKFIEDGSYMRIKTLTLSYDLPKSILERAKINNLRLYVTGENLLTFTKYSGFDPEVNAFGGSNTALGIDYGTYPQTRNIIFGLNVTF